MKKIALVLVATALVFSLMSCSKKKSSDSDIDADLSMFMEEDDGLLHLPYDSTGKIAKGNSCNKLKNVKIIANKDYSKPTPVDVFCDDPEIVKFAGEECVRLAPNGDGNIRVIWLFDKPVDAASLSTFTFSVAGLDVPADNTWTWNIALMYNNEITEGEHATAMYTGPMKTDGWSTTTINLASDEGLWGNSYKPEGQFLGIQVYYGGKDPIFIKDLEVK